MQTLDISTQAPGPRWTLRQWCLYWRDRRVPPPPGFGAAGGEQYTAGPWGGTVPGADGGGLGSEVAAQLSSSSSRGIGDMDDEADSAFVHQG